MDANFMAFLGVNLFIPHAFYYSFEGYRKTDFPQTEFYHAPHWEHYRAFGDYIGRLSLLGSLGRQASKVLLVSPIHTVYQEMFRSGKACKNLHVDELFSLLSDRLIRGRLDFEYADECQIASGTASAGELRFPKCEGGFSIVILPAMKVLGLETAERLLAFVRSGGMLIALEELPVHSAFVTHDPDLASYIEQLFPAPGRAGGWHECGGGKTLFMTAGQLRGDDAAGLCQEIRAKLAGSDLGERWIVPEQSAEHVIMTGRRLEGRSFTWIMNWSDDSVELQYDAAPGEALEEWELETGDIRLITKVELQRFALAPGQMRIVAPRPEAEQPEAKRSQDAAIASAKGMLHTRELSREWDFGTEDRNALILDRWEVTLNDRQARISATMPGQVNTFRRTIKAEQSLIESLNGSGADPSERQYRQDGIYLVLDDLRQDIQSHIGFLSRRRSVEIFVNGERLPALEPAKWQDRFYYWADISPYLQSGDNTIEILTFSLLEPMPNFAYPAFLVGEFALTSAEALTAPPNRMSGYWTAAGYPHLSGKAVYRQAFDWAPIAAEGDNGGKAVAVVLEIEDIRETARLSVNGSDAGIKLWPPYNWDVTGMLRPGRNTIELQVANTLDNLYGKNALASGIGGSAKLIAYQLE
ncbi:type 1 glutamine amidotransferase family protein [Paenibacillus arenilitoris]|uniref:Beta-galactosidase n=1 Tax=Paenibacillus arenilitoris TaxID=2772299 RepID=A0A927CKT3_9BACL|nr:beta-galactosidase [Paenibacillus arenilitoris]MBD2869280.1 beta-galactosidase [Paenibacillus arenilitoris]